MSRIERALEKAVKMRGSEKEVLSQETSTSENRVSLPKFEVGDPVVDKSRLDRHIVCITEPRSPSAEQYRKLRARIISATEKEFLNTIMIASSDIGEGKSITALNLSVALSNEIDYTVLLVDADLRNPSIHIYLGLDPQYGLSDYLEGKVELSDILIKTGIGKLVILPGGNVPENPAELLSSDKMSSLVKELKFRHKDRYIIFDSSPIITTADTFSLGKYMDGIVLVIQEGRSTQKASIKAISLMKGWNILGVVFNDVPDYLMQGLYPYEYIYGDAQARKKIHFPYIGKRKFD